MNKPIPYLKRCFLSALFLISIGFETEAQPTFQWDRTFGGIEYEELQEIKPLFDGNIIYGGSTQSPGTASDGTVSQAPCKADTTNLDFWLLKTDIYGNHLWDRRYAGDGGRDRLWSVIETVDGGFLLGGDSNSPAGCDKTDDAIVPGGFDMWIIKTDKVGNIEWDVTYGTTGHDELQNLIQLRDSSYFVLGFSNGDASGNLTAPNHSLRNQTDIRLLKLAPDGQLLWDKSYGGHGAEQAYKIQKTIQGDYLIGGFSTSSPLSESGIGNKTAPHYGENDFWLIKIDTDGNIIWDKTYGGDTQDVLINIEETNDGDFLLGGQSDSPVSGTKTKEPFKLRDFYLVKIDSDGKQLWDQVYGGDDYDDGFAMHENADGEILFGGVSRSNKSGNKTQNSQGGNDFWLLFLEPNGDTIWQLSFGGSGDDALTSIFPVADGGLMLGGHSSSNKSGDKTEDNIGLNDFWLIKTACKLKLDLGPDSLICEGENILFDVEQLNCNDCRYRWTDGQLTSVRTVQPPITTKYSVGISSRSGCEISDTILIEVNDAPETFFANINAPKCPGENTGSIRVTDIEGGTPPYYYSFNGGVWNEFNHYFALPPDDYHLELMDVNECYMDTLIHLPEPEIVDIYIDGLDEIQLGDSTQLVPIFSEPVDSFHWDEHPGLSCWDCLTPFARPDETTTFALTYYNNNGCKYVKPATITIRKDRPVYFPTAFSPNNDGDNDHYMFYLGPGVKKVANFSIFGRWGELLHRTSDYQPGDFLKGWDGYHGGRVMAPGTYVYFCDIEWVDGWTERVEGSFNLIR